MAKIKEIFVMKKFQQNLDSIKDNAIIDRVKKQIAGLRENPEKGKPLRYALKGERTIYVKPYRIIYSIEGDNLYLLRFMHRKKVYR